MAHLSTLSLTAVLGLAGIGIGIQLGHAAAGDINPLHFGDRQGTASYAALSPYRSPAGAQAGVAAAPVAEMAEDGGGCIGCRAYPEEARPDRDGTVDGYSASAATPVETVPAQIELAVQDEPPNPFDEAVAQVERYAQDSPDEAAAPETDEAEEPYR